MWGTRQRAGGDLVARHEAEEPDEDGRDLPGGVEALGVEVGDGEAEARRGLEAARGRVHADRGGREGVVGREDEGAPVLAAVVRSVFGAGYDVVPSAEVSGDCEGETVWVGDVRERTLGCWSLKDGR